MTACPCGDISQEPDRNNKSLLTVYLMAFCSRLTCTLPASISFFRAAMSAELRAAWAADACCSWVYWPCSSVYCLCRVVYLPSRVSYLPWETQPARKTAATQSRNRTRRCRPQGRMGRPPSSGVGQKPPSTTVAPSGPLHICPRHDAPQTRDLSGMAHLLRTHLIRDLGSLSIGLWS